MCLCRRRPIYYLLAPCFRESDFRHYFNDVYRQSAAPSAEPDHRAVFHEILSGKNIGFGALLTDESFGVAVNKAAQNGRLYDKWMNGLNITAYMCWVISCVMGGLLGQWISDPYALGLDFALPAMFAALLVLQLQSSASEKLKHSLSLILYMIIFMVLLSYFVPSHIAVIVSTVIVATIGVVTDK